MPPDVSLPPNVPRWKIFSIQIVSSVPGNLVETIAMQPLDLIKTRLQLQSRKAVIGPHAYSGVFDAFVKISRSEGFLSFWRGILPPLMSVTPKRIVKFFVFEQAKPIFLFGAPIPTPLTIGLAGGCAGCTEGFLLNPFEVIKITQQANRKENYKTFSLAKSIIKRHGYGQRGLFKGVTANMLRSATFHTIWFGFFHFAKESTPTLKNAKLDFIRKYFIGFTSGILGSLLASPFDVAKSKIQGPPPLKHINKYPSTYKTIVIVLREQGFSGLYKGIIAQMARTGPSSGFILLAYENVNQVLYKRFIG